MRFDSVRRKRPSGWFWLIELACVLLLLWLLVAYA
jgi:hypothetical protein